MLKRSGVKTDENTNDGAVNLLRHSFITNELSKITTAEDRLALSEKLAHTLIPSSMDHLFPIKILKLEHM